MYLFWLSKRGLTRINWTNDYFLPKLKDQQMKAEQNANGGFLIPPETAAKLRAYVEKIKAYAETEEYKEDKRRVEQGKMPKRLFGKPVECDE